MSEVYKLVMWLGNLSPRAKFISGVLFGAVLAFAGSRVLRVTPREPPLPAVRAPTPAASASERASSIVENWFRAAEREAAEAKPVAREAEAAAPAPAPPPPEEPVSPREHRDKVVAALKASGPDQRYLGVSAVEVERGWTAKLRRLGVDAEFAPFECYAKGCFSTVKHSSRERAELATDVITRSGEFQGWRSSKMRSGIIDGERGSVEVTWVLDVPEPDQKPLPETLPADNFEELKARLARASEAEPATEPSLQQASR